MNEELLNEFKLLFKQHLNNNKQIQMRLAYCKSVNWEEKTMTAIGASDDLEYHNVSLGLGYMLIKPKVDTECIIGILEGEESVGFLLDALEVEEVLFNGGELGGLVKIEQLKENIDTLKKYCEALNSAISIGLSAVGVGSAASGTLGKEAFSKAMVGQEISFTDMENKNIKH